MKNTQTTFKLEDCDYSNRPRVAEVDGSDLENIPSSMLKETFKILAEERKAKEQAKKG